MKTRTQTEILSSVQLANGCWSEFRRSVVCTGANGTNGETYRSSGIVIVIVIEYKNVQFEKDKFAYVYLPRVIDGNEYKAVESLYQSDGSYILKERHGIRLVFQQHGEIGEFSFISPPPLAPLPHQIRTQACESMDGEKTSGYNAASDSAKGPYVEVTDCFRRWDTRL